MRRLNKFTYFALGFMLIWLLAKAFNILPDNNIIEFAGGFAFGTIIIAGIREIISFSKLKKAKRNLFLKKL